MKMGNKSLLKNPRKRVDKTRYLFTSGTMGEITPVLEADGRKIGEGVAGSMTKRIQKLHAEYAYENGEQVPFKKPNKKG